MNHWRTDVLPSFPGYIGVESFWMPPDTRERFLKDPREDYTETSIVYRHNSQGFRTREFEQIPTKPSILCLGDSFTYGIGVRQEDTWPAHIAGMFPGYHVYNLGIPGAAWDTITRFLVNVGGVLDTQIVLIFWPEIVRYELYHTSDIRQLTSQDEKAFPLGMLVDTHFENLANKNRLIVDLMSTRYRYRVFEAMTWNFEGVVDLGRDDHFGPRSHRNLADRFREMIQS